MVFERKLRRILPRILAELLTIFLDYVTTGDSEKYSYLEIRVLVPGSGVLIWVQDLGAVWETKNPKKKSWGLSLLSCYGISFGSIPF